MAQIEKALGLATGTRTGDVLEFKTGTTGQGILNATIFFLGTATVTFTLEGRMSSADAWATVATITEADTGTSVATNLPFMKAVSILPEMRLTVTTAAANFSTAFIMEY